MTRGETARELRRLVRRELQAHLEPAGWRPLDRRAGGPFTLAAFMRPIGEEFAATAEVDVASRVPDRPPVSITDVRAGISYEPLRRLWTLLGTFGVAVAQELPAGYGGEPLFEVAKVADVPYVVEELARLTLARAIPFAEADWSVEGLLDALRHERWLVEEPALCVPALLAAAGRFDEAREKLARDIRRSERRGVEFDTRRTARQLQRWIDSAGDPSLLPDDPPPSRSQLREVEVPSLSKLRRQARGLDEAVAHVARTGRGRDRDALRTMLQGELARRGIEESPLWIEQRLDHLWGNRADRARLAVHGLTLVGRLGLGIAKAVAKRELPDISTPAWLEPPERAAYVLPGVDRWVAAQLEPDAAAWLERAHDAAPRLGATVVNIRAWLDRDPDAPAVPSRLAVHLGERRVGVLLDEAAAPYLPAMQAATFRDELPNVAARLTRRDTPPHWLLELAKPTQPQHGEEQA